MRCVWSLRSIQLTTDSTEGGQLLEKAGGRKKLKMNPCNNQKVKMGFSLLELQVLPNMNNSPPVTPVRNTALLCSLSRLGLLTYSLWENKFVLFQTTKLLVICYGNSRKLMQLFFILISKKYMTYLKTVSPLKIRESHILVVDKERLIYKKSRSLLKADT